MIVLKTNCSKADAISLPMLFNPECFMLYKCICKSTEDKRRLCNPVIKEKSTRKKLYEPFMNKHGQNTYLRVVNLSLASVIVN
jgi:hypothetical protein